MTEKDCTITIIVTLMVIVMTMDKTCDDDEGDEVCWYNVLSLVSSHNNMVNLETWQSKGFVCELLFKPLTRYDLLLLPSYKFQLLI